MTGGSDGVFFVGGKKHATTSPLSKPGAKAADFVRS